MIKDFIVNTQDFVISCNKGNPSIIIAVSDCEKCEFHKGIIQVYPSNQGNESSVKSNEMTLQSLEGKIKNRQYDIVCGLPKRQRAGILAKIPDETEV